MPTQPYHVAGKRVPSVTTVLSKFKDPGALMHWSWQIAHDVLIEAVDLLEYEHKRKERERFLSSKPLVRANYRNVSGDAMTAGTIAHEMVERWIKASARTRSEFFTSMTLRDVILEFAIVRDVAMAALQATQAFGQWIVQNRFELVHTEVPLTSNRHLFGGTLDCVGSLHGKLILFDWKTSGAVYMDYLAQIAAYKLLWNENHPREPITACHLLRFDKLTGDFTDHSFSNLDDAEEYFLILRRAYDLGKQLEKRLR